MHRICEISAYLKYFEPNGKVEPVGKGWTRSRRLNSLSKFEIADRGWTRCQRSDPLQRQDPFTKVGPVEMLQHAWINPSISARRNSWGLPGGPHIGKPHKGIVWNCFSGYVLTACPAKHWNYVWKRSFYKWWCVCSASPRKAMQNHEEISSKVMSKPKHSKLNKNTKTTCKKSTQIR